MIRIAICCGGGFSSSFLAQKLQKECEEKGYGDKYSFIFIPELHLVERQNEVDVAMVCPHMEWNVNHVKDQFTIPVTIIPPRLYGLMPVADFVEDAEDVLELWKQGKKKIVTFDDEPHPLAVKRTVSHRRAVKGESAF